MLCTNYLLYPMLLCFYFYHSGEPFLVSVILYFAPRTAIECWTGVSRELSSQKPENRNEKNILECIIVLMNNIHSRLWNGLFVSFRLKIWN